MFPIFPSDSGYNLKLLTRVLAAEVTKSSIYIREILGNTFLHGELYNRKARKEDYDPIVYTGDLPRKMPQAYGEALDNIGSTFGVTRLPTEGDESLRQRIKFKVKSSTTKSGITDAIKFSLTNSELFRYSDFDVEIRESFLDFFDGVNTPLNSPLRSPSTSLIGGITIYIRPIPKLKSIERVLDYTEDGQPIIESGQMYVSENVNYLSLVRFSSTPTLKATLESLTAAGIVIDRVIFEQIGASGNKGEFYSYYERPGNRRQ